MADELEGAVAEPELEVIDLEELQNAALNEHLGIGVESEEEAEPTPEPTTPAPRRRLQDQVASDPEAAREFEQLAAARDARIRVDAATAERARVQQEADTRQWNDIVAARNAELAYRTQQDAWLDREADRDPIGTRDLVAAEKGRRATEDTKWGAWVAHNNQKTEVRNALTATERGKEARTHAAVTHVFQTRLPTEVQAVLGGRNYTGDFETGLAAHLSDWVDQLVEHGRKLERAEKSRTGQRERTQTLSELGLAAPVLDTSAPVRGGGNVVPSIAELDSWSLERRLEALEKDPDLYVKAASRRR